MNEHIIETECFTATIRPENQQTREQAEPIRVNVKPRAKHCRAVEIFYYPSAKEAMPSIDIANHAASMSSDEAKTVAYVLLDAAKMADELREYVCANFDLPEKDPSGSEEERLAVIVELIQSGRPITNENITQALHELALRSRDAGI